MPDLELEFDTNRLRYKIVGVGGAGTMQLINDFFSSKGVEFIAINTEPSIIVITGAYESRSRKADKRTGRELLPR